MATSAPSEELKATYPSITDWANIPVLDTDQEQRDWVSRNLDSILSELDKGFAMYYANGEGVIGDKVLAVVTPDAAAEIRAKVAEIDWTKEGTCTRRE